MEAMKDEIDVMILCGGSATDLPVIGPKVAASFNTIDSFDTHAKIPEYFANVDKEMCIRDRYKELTEAVESYKDKFESVKIAEPLLGEGGSDATVINADKACLLYTSRCV